MSRENKVLFLSLILLLAGCASNPRQQVRFNKIKNTDIVAPLDVDVVFAYDLKTRGGELGEYLIENEDVLDISVWEVKELTKTAVVRPDGMISYPLIDEIKVGGKTISEVREEIAEKLSRYIKNPRVSVNIQKFGGKRVCVLDETGGGRVVRFTTPIPLLEVLAMSGGYSTNMQIKRIYVIRTPFTPDENVQLIVVNALSILQKADIRENIYVRDGDIVFLARGILSCIDEVRNQVAKIINWSYVVKVNERLTATLQSAGNQGNANSIGNFYGF